VAVELRRGGLHLTGTSLWLDATRKAELSFVSHAHSDHIARHERVIATAATLRLMEHRLGTVKSPLPVPYRRPFQLGPLWIELFPAGHVLGSAQIRVIREDGLRVVYTGDLNLVPSLTAEATEIPECDVLVIESTFGHPRYRFPPKEEVLETVVRWIGEVQARGEWPILLGYPLGKSQEVIRHLSDRGFSICAHRSIHELSRIYEELGTKVGNVRRFEGELRPGEVGFFPPHAVRKGALAQLGRTRRAVLTGWAVDPGVARRYGADDAFCISDHADCASLIAYAKTTGAEEIICVHGFTEELAEAMRAAGLDARKVGERQQLDLFSAGGTSRATRRQTGT
jgi:putative mRNA 3-end processing factor